MSTAKSALPKAVQRQVAQANKIMEDMGKPPSPPAPPPNGAAPNDPPVTPPVAATPPNGAAPNDPPVTPPSPPAPETPPPEEPWEHKYRVLQGKYNAEVPRLQRALEESQSVIGELRQRQNNMETMLASMRATSTPAAAPTPPKPVISPEEVETYGADLIDVMRRAAREEAERIVAAGVKPLTEKIGKVEQSASQVVKTVAQSSQERTIAELAQQVPNWEELNNDEGFLRWLDQVDPYAGTKRGALLRHAFAANDAPRVVAFFKGYLTENAAVTARTTPPAPSAPSAPPEPQTPLQTLVAPGAPKAPTASAPNDAGKRVWTQKEVSALYAQKSEFIRRNPGKPIPAELDKLERDLFKAQSEGRLR